MNKTNETNVTQLHTTTYRNPLDLLPTLSRTGQLGALRSLAAAIQFTLINTADWKVRQELGLVPDNATLDKRNEQDEFARFSDTDADGNSAEREEMSERGFEVRQTPEEKLQQYSRFYYGVVDLIRQLHPANEYERPQSIFTVLDGFKPRGRAWTEEQLALMKAAELDPGEFDAGRDAVNSKRAQEMAERKPQIEQILKDNKDVNPDADVFEELPVHIQLRLGTTLWKGVYYKRIGLVRYMAASSKFDDIGELKILESDMAAIEKWCRDFETQHSEFFAAAIEAGMDIYTIDDAKAQVKRKRN